LIYLFNINLKDTLTPASSATYVADSANLVIYDGSGNEIIGTRNNDLDGTTQAFPLDGAGYTIGDAYLNVDGVQGLQRGHSAVVKYRVTINNSIDKALADENFVVSNSVLMTASTPDSSSPDVIKTTTNKTSLSVPFTDGEVFFYNSGFTALATAYNAGDTLGLQVTDADQKDKTTLTVKVTNQATGEIENVTLSIFDAALGIFRGTLATDNIAGAGTDNTGRLNVQDGQPQPLKVEYTDPASGAFADNPTNQGIIPTTYNEVTAKANIKTASVGTPPTPSDGELKIFSDTGYSIVKTQYGEGDELYLQVVDIDQNSKTTINVVVTSSTGDSVTVTLNKTAPNTFQGSLQTATSGLVLGDSLLFTVLGSTIQADYTDPIFGVGGASGFDNPFHIGIPANAGDIDTGLANRVSATVIKTKVLYLSADINGGGDTTGDLDRTQGASTLTTAAIGSTETPNGTAIVDVTVPVGGAGADQVLSAASQHFGQRFKTTATMTTIGRFQLRLEDVASPANTGKVFAYLRDSWNGANLASASIDASGIATGNSAWYTFDFVDVTVAISSYYYLILDNQSSAAINWRYDGDGAYDAENSYAIKSDGTALGANDDFRFQVNNNDDAAYEVSINTNSTSLDQVPASKSTLYAQSFTTTSTTPISGVKLMLQDTNAAANTGTVHVYLRSAINGVNLAETSVAATSITSSYSQVDFNFTNFTPINGTKYYIVVDNQSSGTTLNWQYATSNVFANGDYVNASTITATGSPDTAKDFLFDVYDASNVSLYSNSSAGGSNVATVTNGQYAGQSFVYSTGGANYILDKVSLKLKDTDGVDHSGVLTLSVLSGNVDNTGTVLASVDVNANTLDLAALTAVNFDFATNPTLQKGTQYFLKLTNSSGASIDWEKASSDVYASNNSYNNNTTAIANDFGFKLYESTLTPATATFTESIPMATDLIVPDKGIINVVSYLSAVQAGFEPAKVTAKLTHAGTSFLNLGNPTYDAGAGTLTWSYTVSGATTFTAGTAVKLEITSTDADSFKIDYDNASKNSRIELPTTTVINIVDVDAASGTQLIGFYDKPFSDLTSSLITSNSITAGSMVYVRVKVSDPFGDYDIRNLQLTINDSIAGASSGDVATVTLTDANIVNSASDGAAFKTYEYAWQTVNTIGLYDVGVVAQEGYESITASANTSFTVYTLDLGTPSKTEFITGLGGTVVADGATYASGATAYLRVTDMDESNNVTVKAIVNGTTYTLTETAVKGIFEGTLTTYPDGTVLTANYVDNGRTPTDIYADPTDTSADTINYAASNSPPTLDLDTTNSGTVNNSVTFNEGDAPIAFVKDAAGTPITDNTTAIRDLTISILKSDIKDGASEQLLINTATSGGTIALDFANAAAILNIVLGGVTYKVTVTDDGTTKTLKIANNAAGNLTIAQIEALLEALRYNNTNLNPTDANRVFTLVVNDGDTVVSQPLNSNTSTFTVAVHKIDNPPVVDLDETNALSLDNTKTFTEGGAAVNFTAGATNLSDVDSTLLANLTISINKNTLQTGDQLILGANTIDITNTAGSTVLTTTYGGVTFVYTIVDNGSTRTITFTNNVVSNEAIGAYELLLDALQYQNTSTAAGGSRSFAVSVTDDTSQTPVVVPNFVVNIASVNDAPVFTGLNGTPTFTQGGTAVVLDSDVTLTDLNLASLSGGVGNYDGTTLTLQRTGAANALTMSFLAREL
jgi:hypothetical protein